MKETLDMNRFCPKVKGLVAITLVFEVDEGRGSKGVKEETQRKLDYAECEKGRECGAEGSNCMWAVPFPSDKDPKDYPGIR